VYQRRTPLIHETLPDEVRLADSEGYRGTPLIHEPR
jgi:hypothetical protein